MVKRVKCPECEFEMKSERECKRDNERFLRSLSKAKVAENYVTISCILGS